MDYFFAVQEGRARVKKAVDLLQEVAGPSFPVLFLRPGREDWTPVGEESLYSLVSGKNATAALVICDDEGNSKAMSSWVPAREAEEFAAKLKAKGVPKFAGEVRLPI